MSVGPLTEPDARAVRAQLGRPPRDLAGVGHRCPCGLPDVVETRPRLSDGAPFPTLYYLTCPRAVSQVSALEAAGLMAELTRRLAADEGLRAGYRAAHRAYLADRVELGDVPEIADVSAGGMPDRVKCLHALVAHSLVAGPGVNPVGDEALTMLARWWQPGACVAVPGSEAAR
ncbi:MAG TPA: DUF501 domain-containing protein [Nocardioidaceae bacterium]|nr:DUF501 domain-containing protein [Nocardioidaceae bacterium]